MCGIWCPFPSVPPMQSMVTHEEVDTDTVALTVVIFYVR